MLNLYVLCELTFLEKKISRRRESSIYYIFYICIYIWKFYICFWGRIKSSFRCVSCSTDDITGLQIKRTFWKSENGNTFLLFIRLWIGEFVSCAKTKLFITFTSCLQAVAGRIGCHSTVSSNCRELIIFSSWKR